MIYDLASFAGVFKDATITYTGETITIMFRNRDNLSHELKIALSGVVKKPIHFIFQSKQGFKQEWWFLGFNHNPLGGAALQTITDTDYLEHHYTKKGRLGCDYAPALVEHQYGKKYREEWVITTGEKHREDGPAIIRINYGLPTTTAFSHFDARVMEWYHMDKPFNNGSWTKLSDGGGVETHETSSKGLMRTLRVTERVIGWYDEKEELHRTDGPASIRFTEFKEIDSVGNKLTWRWKDWHGDWYIHGKRIPYGDILKWSKKHRILMWNEPCYNRSAFRTDDGEVLFLTDIAGAIK